MSFGAADVVFPGANGSVDAELRNADGRVVKVYQGNPATEPGASITFTGLPMSTYTLFVRRSAVPSDGPEQVDFPWTSAAVDLVSNQTVNLGPLLLNQPTVNLTGTLPGGQVKLTAVPEDAWLRPSHIDGDQATPMAVNWTVQGATPGGTSCAASCLAPMPRCHRRRRERPDKPSGTGANLAATHSTVVVSGPPRPRRSPHRPGRR